MKSLNHSPWAYVTCILMLVNVASYGSVPEIRLSELFKKGEWPFATTEYMLDSNQSLRDTVLFSFILVNDFPSDTTIHYSDAGNEWMHFKATSLDSTAAPISQLSGRNFLAIIPYENIDYPTRPLRLAANTSYQVDLKLKGKAYMPISHYPRFFTPSRHVEVLKQADGWYTTNYIIAYLFIGAMGFGFFFFFFLYLKSRYQLFGLYSLFLLIHVLYGTYQIDPYTVVGRLYFTKAHWDDFQSELLPFIAQGIYVQFMIMWLRLKEQNMVAYRIFNAISIFFFTYAIGFTVFYHIDRMNPLLSFLEGMIRIGAICIQLLVFYILIFKVKSPVKGYILTGTALLVFFGVIMVYADISGLMNNTYLSVIDYGSWYMFGLLSESICFSMGLGLRYFLIDRENVKLHEENIQVLSDKLLTEQQARENEKKLATLDQELTNQQLTSLRAQMNPHFIFNALNSIQKYIVKGSVDEANSYLSKFSRLQRMILSYCEENFITLDKEIDMLRLYLELEQLRLTNEFTFSIQIDEDIEPEEIPIPPMMLQPFVENAIWHGLVPKEGDKVLHVSFVLSGRDVLQCIVDDNGIGRKAAQKMKDDKQMDRTVNRSKGMTLVYNRLELLERKYDRKFSVRIIDKEDEQHQSTGTKVIVDIPVVD